MCTGKVLNYCNGTVQVLLGVRLRREIEWKVIRIISGQCPPTEKGAPDMEKWVKRSLSTSELDCISLI